jgi:hypothetical protein
MAQELPPSILSYGGTCHRSLTAKMLCCVSDSVQLGIGARVLDALHVGPPQRTVIFRCSARGSRPRLFAPLNAIDYSAIVVLSCLRSICLLCSTIRDAHGRSEPARVRRAPCSCSGRGRTGGRT